MLSEYSIAPRRRRCPGEGKRAGREGAQETLRPRAARPRPGLQPRRPTRPTAPQAHSKAAQGRPSPRAASLPRRAPPARHRPAAGRRRGLWARGERRGRRALTFPGGTKAAASGTGDGSGSAYSGLLDYASQNSRRERGRGTSVLSGSYRPRRSRTTPCGAAGPFRPLPRAAVTAAAPRLCRVCDSSRVWNEFQQRAFLEPTCSAALLAPTGRAARAAARASEPAGSPAREPARFLSGGQSLGGPYALF